MAEERAEDKEPLSCRPSYQATCRRVKDCCAVLHNAMQKWAGLNGESSTVANKLVNITTECSYLQDGHMMGVLSGNEELRKRMVGKLLEEREQLYASLKHLLSEMVLYSLYPIVDFLILG